MFTILFLVAACFSASLAQTCAVEYNLLATSTTKCYKYNAKPLGFADAETSCEGFGGNLVSIPHAFENSAVAGNYGFG